MIDTNSKTVQLVENFFAPYQSYKYKKGEIVLRADDAPNGVYYLRDGFVRQYVIASTGDTFILHVYKPGSFFPLMWIINDIPNTYYFESISQAHIVRAPKDVFVRFMKQNPEVVWYAMQKIVAGLHGMATRVSQLVLDDAYVKTALLLVYYGANFGSQTQRGIRLEIPLTHREIASWIGTTRETASIQIEKLQKAGLIVVERRQIYIPNLAALVKITQVN